MDENFGPSLASLTRSCVESLGRGWWLLQSADSTQLRYRAAAMRHKELTTLTKNGVAFRTITPNGDVKAKRSPLAQAETELAQATVAGREEDVPGYTQLFVALLEASGGSRARADYSELSGIAHGERTMTLQVGELRATAHTASGWSGVHGLPLSYANKLIWIASETLNTFMRELIDAWGIPAEKARWGAATHRASHTFQTLFDHATNDADSERSPRM